MTSAARSEEGSTLIEVLISVVILGLAVTAFLLGTTTNIGTSRLASEQATGETALISAGEQVLDQNQRPYTCQATPLVKAAYYPTQPYGWSTSINSVQYWDPDVAPAGSWEDYDYAPSPPQPPWVPCPLGVSRLQKLTIMVQSPDRQITLSRDYVKAPPS